MKAKKSTIIDGAVTKIRSAGNKIVVAAESGKLFTILAETLEVVDEFSVDGVDFYRYTSGFDISNDGRYLAYAIKEKPSYKIVDISLKKMVAELSHLHSSEVYTLSFCNFSKKLASGGMDGKSYVFDFDTKKAIGPFGIRSDFISAFAFHPGGNYIAIAGYDNEIKIYKLDDREDFATLTGLNEPIVAIRYINTKELAVFYRDGRTLIFDTTLHKIRANLKKLNDGISTFEIIGDYAYVCARERNIRLFDLRSYEELSEAIIKAPSIVTYISKHTESAVLVGCLDGSLHLYELDSDNKELERLVMDGLFTEAYALVEANPFLKKDDNFTILEEAWQMSLADIVHSIEDGHLNAAKKMAQSYMQIAEKRLVLQTVFKQFEEFPKLKYAIEHSNNELIKSLIRKNNYFKMTKLYEKIKNHI